MICLRLLRYEQNVIGDQVTGDELRFFSSLRKAEAWLKANGFYKGQRSWLKYDSEKDWDWVHIQDGYWDYIVVDVIDDDRDRDDPMEVRTKISIPLFARRDGDKQLQEQDGSAPAPFEYYQGDLQIMLCLAVAKVVALGLERGSPAKEKYFESEKTSLEGSLKPDPEIIEKVLALFDFSFSVMSNNREKVQALADECYDAIGETARRSADEISKEYKKWINGADMMIGNINLPTAGSACCIPGYCASGTR